jgi:hypothetical protein
MDGAAMARGHLGQPPAIEAVVPLSKKIAWRLLPRGMTSCA